MTDRSIRQQLRRPGHLAGAFRRLHKRDRGAGAWRVAGPIAGNAIIAEAGDGTAHQRDAGRIVHNGGIRQAHSRCTVVRGQSYPIVGNHAVLDIAHCTGLLHRDAEGDIAGDD